MPEEQEKYVVQGTNQQFRLTFTSADLVDVDTNPEGRVDLTGATIYYRWKRNQGDANPAEVSKSSAAPTEIDILAQSGDTLGQADVFLVPGDTELLTPGTHYYDAWVQLSTGIRHASIPPSRVFLVDAVTDLDSPSPPPEYGVVTLIDDTPVETDAALGSVFDVTLGALGTRELANPTALTTGQRYWWIVRTGAGSEAVTFGSLFKWPGGTAPTVTAGASATDVFTALYDGTNLLARTYAQDLS